ncbi:MAG: YihY/virulence factor BrkB family protein [Cyanosarcina radialis HA8281-LM2]|jgi:membrane protein|nr:YihY/virulence factor BrkB family protein [Cyanosarcina radialis HA8281-LM2]
MSWRTIWRLLKETFQEWNRDNAPQMAAALAYYTVFSIAPLLIIAIAIAGWAFGEEAARGEIVGQIRDLVGKEGAQAIEATLENAYRPGGNTGIVASLISIVLLIFGASGVFVQLQESLNAIWNVTPQSGNEVGNFVRKRALSFVVVLGIGFLLLVSLIVSAALAGLNHYASSLIPGLESWWQLINSVISFGVITILFALIFKYLPDITITWRDVWVGAIITSLLFSIGKFAIGLYLGNSSLGSTYGAAGSLVVFLAWIYYSVQIMFFGAEFTQVYTRRYGSHRKAK